MAETITLDPSAVATGRTELDITSWVDADPGVDWGDAAIQAYMADQAVGSSPVDYRLPNRMIKIPLNLRDVSGTTFASIRQSIQAKAGLFQREGGWIMRQVDSTPLYADIVTATLTLGGSIYQAFRGFDVDAVLQLECLPDWYGAEVTLDAVSVTEFHASVLQQASAQAVIAGNYPARCRILCYAGQAGIWQAEMMWAFRSRYYDAATTAQLAYAATGSPWTRHSSAISTTQSGSINTNVVKTGTLTTTWSNQLTSPATGSSPFTHLGTYRVWARVYTTATTKPSLRLRWNIGAVLPQLTNDPITVDQASTWTKVSLGTIRIDPLPASMGGTGLYWQAEIDGLGTGSETIVIDEIWLQPLDESAGLAGILQSDGGMVSTANQVEIRTDGAYRFNGSSFGKMGQVVGDLPRLPPSGLEGRPVEFFIKASRGILTGDNTVVDLGSTDTYSAQVIYRPSYLYTP